MKRGKTTGKPISHRKTIVAHHEQNHNAPLLLLCSSDLQLRQIQFSTQVRHGCGKRRGRGNGAEGNKPELAKHAKQQKQIADFSLIYPVSSLPSPHRSPPSPHTHRITPGTRKNTPKKSPQKSRRKTPQRHSQRCASMCG